MIKLVNIYIEGMPNEYNWIVQKLLANREIGIVVSDRSLCLGIDLPIIQFNPIDNVKESFELLTKTFSGDSNE